MTANVRIEHNFDIKSKEIKKFAGKLSSSSRGSGVLLQAMHASLQEVGFVSTGDFMDLNASLTSAVGSKLSRRSSRLSRSILGSEHGEHGNESIRKVTVRPGKLEGKIGSKVPYAEIHEKGGTVHPKVTAKSRGFFWAKYFETGEDKWRAMALTSRSQFDVTIPARPYLAPAAKKAMPAIHDIFSDYIHQAFSRERI